MKKKATKKTTSKPSKKRSFVFCGDLIGGDNPSWCHMHGYSFKLGGAAVKVKDEHAAKLATHSHFKEK